MTESLVLEILLEAGHVLHELGVGQLVVLRGRTLVHVHAGLFQPEMLEGITGQKVEPELIDRGTVLVLQSQLEFIHQSKESLVLFVDGFDARTLRELRAIVSENREKIEKAWNEHFA